MLLHLSMLDGTGAQKIIQLDCVDGSCTLLILTGLRPNPEVNIIGQGAAYFPSLERENVFLSLTQNSLWKHKKPNSQSC